MTETVLVTGISGFIAKHVALALLREGYSVRGTLRSFSREEEVRKALAEAGRDEERLTLVEADLTSDQGWAEAVEGCTFVQHVASPFPMAQPRDREALVPAARDGALRVLRAAARADVARMILTSSMGAMMYRPDRPTQVSVGEGDWSDPDWKVLSPYFISKTRAEQAAWAWARDNDWTDRLTVVNPGFVLGPTLDGGTSTSLDVIKMVMTGAYPAFPPVSYPVVDVRDLADLHVSAMTAPRAGGRRLIGSGTTLSMQEMAGILKEKFPEFAKKIPTRSLPGLLARLLAVFDPNVRSVLPDLGVRPVAETGYVTEVTGVTFRPPEKALVAGARSLIEHGVVTAPTR
jgi:dihydroflavonol-4-reductase